MARRAAEARRKPRLVVGCDHAGFRLKAFLVRHLRKRRYPLLDVGTRNSRAVDYPEYAVRIGHAIQDGRAELGIMICGSGAGRASQPTSCEGFARRSATTTSRPIRRARTMTPTSSAWGRG